MRWELEGVEFVLDSIDGESHSIESCWTKEVNRIRQKRIVAAAVRRIMVVLVVERQLDCVAFVLDWKKGH